MKPERESSEIADALQRLQQALAGPWRAEAMHRIVRSVGPRHEAGDIFDSFFVDTLPGLARHIAIGRIQDERAYVLAALANHARRFLREQRRHEDALRNIDEEAVFAEPPESATLPPITDEVLAKIEPRRAEAARLFLGVARPEGRGLSVNEIAERLGWTRWAARAAVVDGLLSVAVAMGASGSLSPREVEACRLLLLEGVALEEAARAMRLSRAELTGALRRAREVVGGTLSSLSRPGVKRGDETVG